MHTIPAIPAPPMTGRRSLVLARPGHGVAFLSKTRSALRLVVLLFGREVATGGIVRVVAGGQCIRWSQPNSQ